MQAGIWSSWSTLALLVRMENVNSHHGKAVQQCLKKLNIDLPYDPTISLLDDSHLGEMKTYVRTHIHNITYMQMFIAALVMIAKNWK